MEDSSLDITIVSQHFYPDTSANSVVLSELASGLASNGHDISVVTAPPGYTSDDRSLEYHSSEEWNGVDITRLPSTRFNKNRGVAWRLVNELSFFLLALLYTAFRRRRTLLVLPTSPPFLPIGGWFLYKLLGITYVPIVYDIYPDMAAQLGYLSEKGIVYRTWDRLIGAAYSDADRIITIGDTMKETIEQKTTDRRGKIAVIHNWEDGEEIKPQEKAQNQFSKKHDLVDKFVVLYSGNIGLFHGLEPTIDAAAELEQRFEQPTEAFEFVFIGDGGMKNKLQKLTAEKGLDTVTFLPYQPKSELPNSLTAGDVSLVTMRNDTVGLCVPSKFYTSLATGQPIFAIARKDSEIGRVVDETGCGIRVDPGSSKQIADAVEKWITNPELQTQMGKRARQVFEEHYTYQRAISRFEEELRAVTSVRG